MHPIITTSWLSENLQNPNLILLDASQTENKSGLTSDYLGVQIPGSRTFDLKNHFSDPNGTYPNTLPSTEQFQTEARKLGINNAHTLVVYDNLGIYNSPRVWWLFQIMGHSNVVVLDGGLPRWIQEGNPTEPKQTSPIVPGNFSAQFNPEMLTNIAQVKGNILLNTSLVIDARSKGRFDGTAPEPRPGMSSGHVPKSANLPFEEVLSDGRFKSESALKKLFNGLGINDQPMIFSCGSGLTACILLMAAELAQLPNPKTVFDGSWTEWASTEGMPIETS